MSRKEVILKNLDHSVLEALSEVSLEEKKEENVFTHE